MAVNSPLSGLKILLTRPEKQAQHLCEMIGSAGGEVIRFPVIDIKKIAATKWTYADLQSLDMIIFISRNAVIHFVQQNKQSIPDSVLLVSVGAGSAASMREYGLTVDIEPRQSGSEALLALAELADMSAKKVLIVRGQGGRELLADTLRQRGAELSYLEVYQRLLTSPSQGLCQQALTADRVICSSVEGVRNLSLLLKKGLKNIHDKPMLVISERIKTAALSLGFEQVWVAENASDEAVMTQLTKMGTT